ncbi:MAG: LysM peptidoglycan-binding domain-containing protein [Lawsonibacter sp.]|nr:LysM peptidoglycan-binding domain-containing protein [Lawsonibacter sp.]
MRFRSYTWPHNPRVYSIDYHRMVSAHKLPFGLYQLQDLGRTNRVMKGEGEFVGEGAYGQFGQLANTFYAEGPGLLVHPLWQASNAYFVALRLEQEPRPDYVRYSFEFWEENEQCSGVATRVIDVVQAGGGTGETSAPSPQAVWHRVVKGDTLWALAQRYGLSLAELIALNPQIKNPNLIRVGEEVRVG